MARLVSIYDERNKFQEDFVAHLVEENCFRERKAKDFNSLYAMDEDLLFEFLYKTQKETMEDLEEVYKEALRPVLLDYINLEITRNGGRLLEVLKYGIEIANRRLDLMYTRPATDYNKDLMEKYEANIFSVIQEVWANDSERVDLVIFLNGLALMSFELKSEFSGQSYKNAISQYRTERDPKSRLFLWKAGCLVNFAMDTSNVYMTTRLDGPDTYFLPFNKGRGEGIETGAGNPLVPGKHPVSYMWEEILKKDSILDLFSKFIFIERKFVEDEKIKKVKAKETVIFPRFHQLDLIRKILEDIKNSSEKKNYLIQHSAGSGKTNSIAWLAHRLVSLHDENNKVYYDTIIIVTDRVVVDRQLQDAIKNLDHAHGLIRVMDEGCSSSDLRQALEGNTKIIASTIQKFPYIVDEISGLKDKTFAVIIDEAHSSTAGKNMQAVNQALGSSAGDFEDVDDMIVDQIKRSGKQENVSMFAFTATPKPSTLKIFGRKNANGNYEAFHLYSMKQAIEEGFILDVLQNYTTYSTFYKINKEVEDDPDLKTSQAKREIARLIDLDDTNISQRVQIIVEHFRTSVMPGLKGQAKAMVVTASRKAAVKYMLEFERYIEKKGYRDVRPLIAFSGKVTLDDEDDQVYTETLVNDMPEEMLVRNFDSPKYNVLIVANKYQTGFDQKKLSAMYIMKKLSGVNAVQTLSRLNRVCPPYDKKVFVLDFVNSYEEILDAFAPYYTTTLLAADLDFSKLNDLLTRIKAYYIIDPLDVERASEIFFKPGNGPLTKAEEDSLLFNLRTSEKRFMALEEGYQRSFLTKLKSFRKYYEFLTQVSVYEDLEAHKYYVYILNLIKLLNISSPGPGFDIKSMVSLSDFYQKIDQTHQDEKIISDPIVDPSLVGGGSSSLDNKKKLSQIIEDLNTRMGKTFNVDETSRAILEIVGSLENSSGLKISAKNNDEDNFTLSFYKEVENALINALGQNSDLYGYLIDNPKAQEDVFGIFLGGIYNNLRSHN